MTKQVYITDIKEIKGVKISCSCGAKIEVPIGVNFTIDKCFSCRKALDYFAINRFVMAIAEIQQGIKDSKYQVCFETEENIR